MQIFKFIRSCFVMFSTTMTFIVAYFSFFISEASISTQTLPAGVRSFYLKNGVSSNLNQKYTSEGKLMDIGDLSSVEFNIDNLEKFEPKIKELRSALNKFGQQDYGDQIHLGTLHIETKPQVQYFAPVLAYGLTHQWTVAIAIPRINYKNQIQLKSESSNIKSLKKQFSGISAGLDSALNSLDIDTTSAARSSLSEKGYAPLENKNENFWGDTQIVSLYNLHKNDILSFTSKTIATLATGPQDNPDDLMDIENFHRNSLEQSIISDLKLFKYFRLSGLVGYQHFIPHKMDKRVPKNEEDTLPDSSTKENVERQIGSKLTIGAQIAFSPIESTEVYAGIEEFKKQKDSYTGRNNSNYAILEQKTESQAKIIKLGAAYDTISSYFKKEAIAPFLIAYEYTDTISGINSPRLNFHELSLVMFF